MPIIQPIPASRKRVLDIITSYKKTYRFKHRIGWYDPRTEITAAVQDYPLISCDALYDRDQWTGNAWLFSVASYPTQYLRAAMHAAIKGWASTFAIVPARTNCRWFWELCYPAKIRFLLGRPQDLNLVPIRRPMMIVIYSPGCLRHLNPDDFLPETSE